MKITIRNDAGDLVEIDPFDGWGAEDAEGGRTYPLKRPVTVTFSSPSGERQERLESIRMRRASGADLLALEKLRGGGFSVLLAQIERLTGIDASVLQRLDTEDLGPLGLAASALLGAGLSTGTTA